MDNSKLDKGHSENNEPKAFRLGVSPVMGNLKIGPIRTHLYNYAFASHEKLKNPQSKVYFRVDDTNQEKGDLQTSNKIFSFFTENLGMVFDSFNGEERIFQSRRMNLYQEFVEELYSNNIAFIEKDSGIALFDIEKFINYYGETLTVTDVARGEINFNVKELLKKQKFFPLIRSDGNALYNLATTVDDHAMSISHVVRGNVHLNTLQFQEMIRVALGLQSKKYLHVPMLQNTQESMEYYDSFVKAGILPQALLSYMMSSGYGDPDTIYDSLASIINDFDHTKIRKANGAFDLAKLKSINRKIISSISEDDYFISAKLYLLKTANNQLQNVFENNEAFNDLAFKLKIPFEKLAEFYSSLHVAESSVFSKLDAPQKESVIKILSKIERDELDPRDILYGSNIEDIQALRLITYGTGTFSDLGSAFFYLYNNGFLLEKLQKIKEILLQ